MNRLLFAMFYAAACSGIAAGRTARALDWSTKDVAYDGWDLAVSMWRKWKSESVSRGKSGS